MKIVWILVSFVNTPGFYQQYSQTFATKAECISKIETTCLSGANALDGVCYRTCVKQEIDPTKLSNKISMD